MPDYHIPVLLKESVEGLNIKSDGVYLDLTFGGGGHSGEILKHLKEGWLIGFDQDEDVLNHLPENENFIFVNHNFKYLRHFLKYHGFDKVDGVLADLGVSSHEFDEAGRGFSFRFDAELDMRMNRRSKMKASDILNRYSEEKLTEIFRHYGEVENAKRLANVIVKGRIDHPVSTSGEFHELIRSCIPQAKEKKYLAKVYQALRIEVNGELEALKRMLESVYEVLNPGGRVVVISYHSLEDRLVKNYFRTGNFEGKEIKDPIYGNVKKIFNEVHRKVIVPGEEELEQNPRSRSAKLRIAEKF